MNKTQREPRLVKVSKAPARSTANTVTVPAAGVRSEDHGRKVKRGMARARARGRRLGRPRKPLTKEQAALAIRLRREEGWGYRHIAREVNRLRGADQLARRAEPRPVGEASASRTSRGSSGGLEIDRFYNKIIPEEYPLLVENFNNIKFKT